jgi:hypothetical protein
MDSHVSKELSAAIFSVEDGCIEFVRNVGMHVIR